MLSNVASQSRPFAAYDGVFCSAPPSLSLCSAGLKLLRLRGRPDFRVRRIACHCDMRTGRRTSSFTASATEDFSSEPKDVGKEQEVSGIIIPCALLYLLSRTCRGDLQNEVAEGICRLRFREPQLLVWSCRSKKGSP